jgi:UDP:flavonoid glycosyltransferase YjiC (YdhE family)
MPPPSVPGTVFPMTHDVTARPGCVLFVGVPAVGHVTPMMPLARELARHGERVVVASGPDVAGLVTDAGLTFRRVGPAFGTWFATLAGRTSGPPGAGLAPEHVERYFVPRLFGEVGLTAMRDDLDAVVRDLRPDLLIFEPNALAAPLVAASHDIPAVQHLIGLRSDALVLDLVNDAVTPAWSAAGLPVPPATGLGATTTLSIWPATLDPPPPGVASQPMRTVPLPGPTTALPVTLRQPDRPLVYVTLGTSFNEPAVFSAILGALADLRVTVLVTVGHDRAVEDLGDIPDNAVVTAYISQDLVLPHCTAVVHHGGSGTALGVLAHGKPSVVLPRGADNFAIAARMSSAGAARVVGPGELTATTVREALRSAIGEPGVRASAERVGREIAGMPAPEDLVPVLLRPLAS